MRCVHMHTQAVTPDDRVACYAGVSPDDVDRTAEPLKQSRSVMGSVRHGAGAAPGPLAERPRHVLAGHEDAVACLAVSTELDVAVSGAADGALLFHTLRRGRYAACG